MLATVTRMTARAYHCLRASGQAHFQVPWESIIGGVILLTMLVIALFAPSLAPFEPDTFAGRPLEHPSDDHRLGTNDVGHDILSELLFSTRISLMVAVGAGIGTVLLAVLVGGVAGYLGGWVDMVLMRLIDMMLALPRLPLLILVIALVGPGVMQTTITIALLSWPTPARIIRAQVKRLRQHMFIGMAQHFGASFHHIIGRHLLPHLVPLMTFTMVTSAGRAAAMEAGLAFLGLGDPSAKSWGLMMRYAMDLPGLFLTDRWQWWLLPPGVCITLLILALTLIGIGIENRIQLKAVQQ